MLQPLAPLKGRFRFGFKTAEVPGSALQHYHLHLRPGDEIVKKLGRIRRFTRWEGRS